MKPKWIVWAALVVLLLIGVLTNVMFTYMYHSRSQDRLERCLELAKETNANACFQISSAADSAFSFSISLDHIFVVLTFTGLVVLADRLFSNEARLDRLERNSND